MESDETRRSGNENHDASLCIRRSPARQLKYMSEAAAGREPGTVTPEHGAIYIL